jgi:hypothetical protein
VLSRDAQPPRSDEPTDIYYWRRESLVYEHDLPGRLAGSGIVAPLLLGRFDRPDGTIALWFDDARGVRGTEWAPERYAAAARSLGFAQAQLVPDEPWLSRGFLRDYAAWRRSAAWRQGDWSGLDDDAAWAQPLVRAHFPPELRVELVRLHADREWLVRVSESLPRTLCHLDVWPENLFAPNEEETMLVDWEFAGDGALGEDIGNLVPESALDLFRPAAELPALDALVFRAYLDGLRANGWDGDERVVRLGMCASAVKYDWLVPFMLERAAEESHVAYGRPVNSDRLYTERGAAFMFLAGWAEEARKLAAELGLNDR